MGLFDWWKRNITSVTTMTSVGGRAIYPDVTADNLVDVYASNDMLYTIVNYSAKKFASIPRSVYKDSAYVKRYYSSLRHKDAVRIKKQMKALGEQVDDSEMMRLLKRPNPLMGQDTFFEALYISREINGEAFIWINRGDSEIEGDARYNLRPLELWWLPAQNIELLVDQYDIWGVLGYVLDNNGQRIRLNKEDVIHWRTFNPTFDGYTREHLRGLSPLKAGMKLLTASDASRDAMVSMFQNDGAKGVIYNETLDNLTAEQKDQVERVIGRKINNRDLKGQVATLQGKWGYIDLGRTTVDLQLLEAQDSTFARLCNLYRVSPNLFITGQTRDNLREARKDLITNKMMPDSMNLDDELNRVLSKSFGGQVLVSDFTDLPEMQYELGDMNLILKDMYDRGVISADEYREQMGWEITGLPEHTQFYVGGNIMPITEAAIPSDGLASLE